MTTVSSRDHLSHCLFVCFHFIFIIEAIYRNSFSEKNRNTVKNKAKYTPVALYLF